LEGDEVTVDGTVDLLVDVGAGSQNLDSLVKQAIQVVQSPQLGGHLTVQISFLYHPG
jgi:hypothetical protein